MRMWNVNPKVLCTKHLLGEHVEMHMFVGTLKKGISMRGYVEGGLVETQRIRLRHDQLAAEMLSRGMNHKSPMDYSPNVSEGTVNVDANLIELRRRCPACAARQDAIAAPA